ncbi:hypothetical protein [Phascolarctobacterium succinatutens]|uniref:hypothetical protein n=1 Tax=Phascolarctobacterium succinatutens TaxID=626940 RepID=UPI0040291F14
MSNARIQFSLASEDVWDAYNPQLKEGEIVTVLKANKKVKLVQGKVGGSTYSESIVIWDEDTAETTMSRAEAAAVTATAQANAANGSASKAAASQAAAATSATNAKASENAAKTSETNAKASESAAKNSATSAASSASTASTQAGKAADSATAAAGSATQAGTFATTATNQATAAAKSESNAKAYMDTTKDLSENVNVFVPTVDADGTLTWTNKAGLSNPAAVNIKGAKGDPGPQGPKGDEVTIDEELSATSVNPVQNKIVKVAIDNVTDSIPKTSIANTWTAQQNFYNLTLSRETYSNFDIVSGSDTPITSTMIYPSVTSTFTLNLSNLAGKLRPNQTTVFTAYFIGNGNYPLIITGAGTIKYIGSASDVAVTPYGMLLNILMVTDGGGTLTSIVQASKLEGGA